MLERQIGISAAFQNKEVSGFIYLQNVRIYSNQQNLNGWHEYHPVKSAVVTAAHITLENKATLGLNSKWLKTAKDQRNSSSDFTEICWHI